MRTREVLERVSRTTLPIPRLAGRAPASGTVEASAALQQQLRWADETVNPMSMVQDVAAAVASTRNGPLAL